MKTTVPYLMAVAAMATLSLSPARADDITTHPTIGAHGTISSRTPDAIVIKNETDPAPVTYGFSRTTQYFDENGRPVSVEVVKSGAPVDVQYTKEGDRLIATRVTVYTASKATPGNTPSVALHKTTVTTEAPDGTIKTKTSQHGDITTHPTYAKGVMTSRAPDSFVVQSETDTSPVTYTFTKTTQYVNEAGEPVSVEVVRSGAPVTVEYVQDGTQLRASRVIVHENGAKAAARPFVPEGSAPVAPPAR
jgi:hypothetical protein